MVNRKIPKEARNTSKDQRKKIADSLAQSLAEGFGLPVEDPFVVVSEHGDGWMFIHPTYMDIQRSPDAMIMPPWLPESTILHLASLLERVSPVRDLHPELSRP
ncbi:tautomerase family protein [Bradyrhizobium sp. Rc2d]|uniref:tautomerase family protein n=1 Tax=Bradyrhizobium sp. Rc2d TaxID=1855321 RepID=UPI000B83D368|nr:tautomerase family protein [Bradyrhizobium sp. Rc2d]